ncbi:CsgG/HfaB family protein [Thermodesulfobacteriota bacterium]
MIPLSRTSFLVSIKYLLLFLMLCCAIFGCVSNAGQEGKFKNGRMYGVTEGLFNHRWWNYHERGISWSQGEFWSEAEADLKAAIKQRGIDQRNARTYGMHFIDYFPHRELGILYYETGRYDLAQGELERSLADEESGRAKYYLNKVRKALVEAADTDKAPPTIELASVGEEKVINRFDLLVSGTVKDDSYAHKVSINEQPLFIELSAKKIPFSQKIKLKKGLNEIRIKTSDLLGKVSEKKMRVFADYQGPALNIRNLVDGQKIGERKITLNGALADASGITSLKINDKLLAYNKEKEIEFAHSMDLQEGDNTIVLAATDLAGNTTTGELNLTYIPQLASNDQSSEEFPGSFFEDGRIRLAFAGSGVLDTGQNLFLGATSAASKRSASRIKIKDLTESQTVYFDTIYIDGTATGMNDIQTLAINGEPALIIPGRTVFFNELFDLREGDNEFTFEVTDSSGTISTKNITIHRSIPKVHQVNSRMSLAILPFQVKGEESMVSEILIDNLISSFMDQNRFHLVSRGEELEAVLQELKLNATDLVDKKTAVKVGQLVAAETILMGTVRETPDSIEVYGRLINTETSTIMSAKDVYGQNKDFSNIQFLMDGLALKFKHEFPLLEGMVIKVSGKDIFADFGSKHRIKKEMKFIVFREGEKIVHPITGKVLGSDTEELGVATVVKVFDDLSMGKLSLDFDQSKIQVQDLIVTK